MNNIACKRITFVVIGILMVLCASNRVNADDVIWTGSGSDNFASNPDNWYRIIIPPNEDHVFFDSTSKDCIWDLDITINSLSIDPGYTGKVILVSNLIIGNRSDTYDVIANGIPQFVGVDYIELDKINQISKFRSGIGHDYSDDYESCRSMKHYYQPKASVDWSTVQVFSPVNGTVSSIYQEWAGIQVQIKSEDYPAFFFIIFHINLANPLNDGDVVTAGQQLGTHIGSQTMSDIAVGVNTPTGWKLLSYFDVIDDSVFQNYLTRGLVSRSDAIISQQDRDADPLTCNGDQFNNPGTLVNWVILN